MRCSRGIVQLYFCSGTKCHRVQEILELQFEDNVLIIKLGKHDVILIYIQVRSRHFRRVVSFVFVRFASSNCQMRDK